MGRNIFYLLLPVSNAQFEIVKCKYIEPYIVLPLLKYILFYTKKQYSIVVHLLWPQKSFAEEMRNVDESDWSRISNFDSVM